MAEWQGGRQPTRPQRIIGAVAVGAVAAGVGIAPASAADPQYPSWQDVQRARRNEAETEAEARTITTLLTRLQDSADSAARTAQIAAEHAHRAQAAEDAARARAADLRTQVIAAKKAAATSRMRAGLLAASMARSAAGGDLSLQLALNGNDADALLYRLATAEQLSAQSDEIYRTAVADQNAAGALQQQATVAADQLQRAAQATAAALADAQAASHAASSAVAAQQANADRLTTQLAALRDTTTQVAAAYVQGVQERRAAAAAVKRREEQEAAARKAAAAQQAQSQGGSAASGGSAGSGSGSGSGAQSGSETGSGSAGGSSSNPPAAPAPVPNQGKAAAVVAFARDQIGDRYVFAGAGPNAWDCSGLTMQAYAAVGIYIGGHGATAQYDLARSEGLLVPYSQAAPGDLVFYTDGGGDMYHVAIYTGGGMMVEAPHEGVPVREVPVRSADLVGQVARFTG
ncbi:C40 family peptidase, partial [uncultured Amnibacterium sp.]|uniref:C40 family peptidase n=1 Tax=uncultured Amnibacterium sp. TaxID=1631851 RepID=UPI0035CBD3CE